MEVLRHCFPTNLRNILEELPKSLDETYKRILKEINNANQEHAYRLLQCLTVASRPLRIEELAEVLAIDFNSGGIPKLKANWRWEDQEAAVLSACSSLVSVITDNGHRVVQFSHFSVKEYLTSDRLASSSDEVSRLHIPIEPSHAILAQACFSVLLCLDDRTDQDGVEKVLPLVQYAAEYWDGHAQVGNVELRIKDALDQFFDVDKPHFLAWVQMRRLWGLVTVSTSGQTVPLSAAPLYFAAERGFRGLVGRLIIKHPQKIHRLGGQHGTPLHASVEGEHIEVAQLLFAHGAGINSCSKGDWTPLHISVSKGRFEIGKWLLDHGADVDFQNNDGWTPLHVAAANGVLEASRILIEHNAAIEARNDVGSTPLLCASKNGRLTVVRLLTDYNADVNEHDDGGNYPLHLAAAYGDVEVTRILLERGAKVNVWNDNGSTPLLIASMKRHYPIVRLLLDHDARVHVHDSAQGNTPLHHVAMHGPFELARTLLERNAEVNSRNDHRSTPLLLASEFGDRRVVQLLLDHGGDAYARDWDGDTPLHCAALRGRLEVTRMLLELNIEVNSRNEKGSTPLHLASAGYGEGFPDVVRLLLDHGADAQVRNFSGKTASEVASGPRQQDIVQLLAQHTAA